MPKIDAPKSLSLRDALDFCNTLSELNETESYVIDFGKTRAVEPCGMLMVSIELGELVGRLGESSISLQKFRHMGYAAHMGFFKAFGFDFGKSPGEAPGGKNYIPLTILSTGAIKREALESYREVGDVVEHRAKRLSGMLIGSDEGESFETLAYSIREIIRNVVEHADAEQFGLCGQYWPTKKKAEIAIVDRGRGLRASLESNPHISPDSNKAALNYALMPAVSGVAFKGARQPNRNSPWVNSGFGLYMTNRICRNGGNFFICSGDAGMMLTTAGQGKRYFKTSHLGTAVRMTINTDRRETLSESLQKYRAEGYELQSKYREAVEINPSAASLMLSQDFDVTLWDKFVSKLKRG